MDSLVSSTLSFSSSEDLLGIASSDLTLALAPVSAVAKGLLEVVDDVLGVDVAAELAVLASVATLLTGGGGGGLIDLEVRSN